MVIYASRILDLNLSPILCELTNYINIPISICWTQWHIVRMKLSTTGLEELRKTTYDPSHSSRPPGREPDPILEHKK